MRLLLIRHGETPDNVAHLDAGSRDSPLTNHGVYQAQSLGTHLANSSETLGPVKHIFVSNLQRAVRTAEAIAAAQVRIGNNVGPVQQLPELREVDFGSREGTRSGSVVSRGPGYVPRESEESMVRRVTRFVHQQLVPFLIKDAAKSLDNGQVGPSCVVVVAHGIILNVLLKFLLLQYGPNELKTHFPGREHRWRNTGYVDAEVRITRSLKTPTPAERPESATPTAVSPRVHPTRPITTYSIALTINRLSNNGHIPGKRTGGGIGSAASDPRQRTLDPHDPFGRIRSNSGGQ